MSSNREEERHVTVSGYSQANIVTGDIHVVTYHQHGVPIEAELSRDLDAAEKAIDQFEELIRSPRSREKLSIDVLRQWRDRNSGLLYLVDKVNEFLHSNDVRERLNKEVWHALDQRMSDLRRRGSLQHHLIEDRMQSFPPASRMNADLGEVMREIAESPHNYSPTPVILYLDIDSQYGEVLLALADALPAFGLELDRGTQAIRGSIWQAFRAVFRRQATPDRLDQAADALTAGAKARWYGEPQSQITKAQGEAISSLLESLKDTQNALLAFSNILIVKIDGVPLVRELTPEQVEHLQHNPGLYTDPKLALSVLDVGLTGARTMGHEPGQQAIAP